MLVVPLNSRYAQHVGKKSKAMGEPLVLGQRVRKNRPKKQRRENKKGVRLASGRGRKGETRSGLLLGRQADWWASHSNGMGGRL